MEFYLVIECGYEGIEKLIFPTTDPQEAANKVKEIRQEIAELQAQRAELLEKKPQLPPEEQIEKEDFEDAWDKLLYDEGITQDQWEKGRFGKPDAYCVQKWDGKEFKCCCPELGVEPSEKWYM